MTWMKRIFYIGVLSSTIMLFGAEKNATVKISHPVASAILLDAYRYLGSLDSFSFNAVTSNDDVYRDTMLVSYLHKVEVSLLRPDKLRVHVFGDLKNKSTYLLNDTFTMIDNEHHFYGQVQVPKTIDSALDHLFENFNIKSPLANLLYTDLDKRLPPKQQGYYFGTTLIDDKVCHHIGFTNENRELQVWIEKSRTPVIKKFVIIDKSRRFDPRSTTVLRWDLHPDFNDDHFLFKAPEGAVRISVSAKEKK
jgi:hypothetical protein